MPGVSLRPDVPGAFVNDDNIVAVLKGRGAVLRYDFDNFEDTGEVFPEGEVTFDNCPIAALDEIWAIVPVVPNLRDDIDDLYDAVVQEKGAVDAKISTDDGLSWLYWDGASWAAAGAGDWSSFRDINLNLDTIPFGDERQLRLRVRIRRGSDIRKSPLLCSVDVGYSLIPDHLFEDPHRTVRRFFEREAVCNFRAVYTAEAAVTTLDLNHPLAVNEVVSVYNLTTDPTRSTNIATGTFTGNVIDLVSVPAIGDDLEVTWNASMEVKLAYKDLDLNDEQLRHVPQILIRIAGSEEFGPAKLSDTPAQYVINIPQESFRRESPAVPIDYRVHVFALAADENLAIKMINACYRTIKDRARLGPIRMVMSGTEGDPLQFTPPFSSLTDTSQHLSVKAFTFILYVKEWFGQPIEGPLAKELQLVFGLTGDC